ncbi:MAG TPA: ABC transporter permease [Thermoanaerobaculia bacterium]|nr:ABC transporter permease [Thermoanaerobaculia bacterium]
MFEMASFWRDVRYGARMMAKVPGHTAAAAIALCLGIGLTTATFSIVYGAMLRGLPFEHGERIMSLVVENPARDVQEREQGVDVHDFLDWRRRQKSFEGLAAFNNGTVTLSGNDKPERLDGAAVTAEMFDLLRVKPILGRAFRRGDDRPGAEPVMLLGYRVWKNRYDGDPRIVGKAVRVNGQPATIVGVMPAECQFPFVEQLWTPLTLDPGKTERGKGDSFGVVGRLRPGVTRQQAAAEMAAISNSLAAEYPRTNRGLLATVEPFTDRWLGKPARLMLLAMFGAVCCVLMIACINVASLIMSRALQRTREIAIRAALGAGRGLVIRQILTESLLLALLGAGVGLGLAWLGVRQFNRALVESNAPVAFWIRCVVDTPALLCALAATVAAAVIAGLVPALQVSRTQLSELLKDEGRGSTSLRLGLFSRTVVIAEIVLSCILLVGAGLMVKSVIRAETVPYGFDTSHLLAVRVPLFEANYPKPTDRAAFYQRLLERLQEQPGVRAVGATTTLPSVNWGSDFFAVDGRAYATESDYPLAHSDVISAGLFAALSVRPIAGREFERLDTADSQPVVIVNQSLARKMWPLDSPLGKRLRLAKTRHTEPWRTVVGVVPDLRLYGLDTKKLDGFYLPIGQSGPTRLSFLIRTPGDPLALVSAVRAQVTALDKDTPIYFVKTMERAILEDRFFNHLFGTLFSLFGLCALLLAAVGIYGVIAFSVQRRTQEIGVRMALGARRGRVLGMLMKQGVVQLAIGLALGLPLAFAGSFLLGAVLFQVEPGDPEVLTLVVAGLSLVAVVACLVPGQRAMDVDPIVALRYD